MFIRQYGEVTLSVKEDVPKRGEVLCASKPDDGTEIYMDFCGSSLPDGANAYMFGNRLFVVTCWADMYEGKFGCPMDANYTDMGYKNLVTVIDTDWYESLRTGLCDSINPTAADVVNNKLYEVANYFLVCPANRVDNWMLINTDAYEGLTDNQKEVLAQACEDLLAYSAQVENDLNDQFVDVVTENGGTVIDMTDEEFQWFLYCGDILGWKTGLETLAAMTGTVDEMAAVQAANREGMNLYTAYDFDALEAKYGE